VKKVEVIVDPSQVGAVRDLLGRVGVDGMSVSEVRDLDEHKCHIELYRGFESRIAFQPKMKVEIVVEDGRIPMLVDEIYRTIRSGWIRDGKIVVVPMDDAVRVRTGERGSDAI
jgi:nitrogen regulatory protein P-II 1